ncbi:hypothetical protein CLPUN_06470 [Clostridium puniceum]|uniref:Bacteriocin n=1 Tax=Clostridium puniceum TaxID=29367 RepID=A0A1S8TWN0_9CLOT|nr:hypothetical protein [Clostridium puniceum]OOM82002.1 hypothetical protein CLPUN_06470 [Clostridium puniceum]
MIKVVNPFNKNMKEVYTSANSCDCACSVGEHATNYSGTRSSGKTGTVCSCGYGTTNMHYNYAL